jgi:uncharacterized protein HemY
MAAWARHGYKGSPEIVNRFRVAVANSPRDARLLLHLGTSLYDIGRYGEAVGVLQRAAAAARRDASVRTLYDWSRLWMGHCYDALGQRPRALAIYRDVARTGEASQQMMMGQYRIGPVTARDWAQQRLESPFRAPT